MQAYYGYKFAHKTMFNDHLIVNELPARVRTELILQQYSELISRVPFFAGLHQVPTCALVYVCATWCCLTWLVWWVEMGSSCACVRLTGARMICSGDDC